MLFITTREEDLRNIYSYLSVAYIDHPISSLSAIRQTYQGGILAYIYNRAIKDTILAFHTD
jgi:hypothetical protein